MKIKDEDQEGENTLELRAIIQDTENGTYRLTAPDERIIELIRESV